MIKKAFTQYLRCLSPAFSVWLILSFSALTWADDFYGLPIPDNISHIKVKDGQYDTFATMRFATEVSPKIISDFYKERLTQSLSISTFKNTTIIHIEIDKVKKLISITNYLGIADVVLQSDKSTPQEISKPLIKQ